MESAFFSNVLIKMWGEDKPQRVVVSVGHVQENQNTEDFDFDSMVYFYFQDDVEYASAFEEGWDDGFSPENASQFYILEELD
jgi:hypothetical protein